MSEGTRFLVLDKVYRTPTNYVTTRGWGDIPGCVPAVDVFIERDISWVQCFNDQQIPIYAKAIRKEGSWPKTLEPIKNRSVPIKQNYFAS